MRGVNMGVAKKLWISVFLLTWHHSSSFHLPVVAPQEFSIGDELRVKVNKMTSPNTLLTSSYYSLPYCRPQRIVDSVENVGEVLRVLRGDRIQNSPYVFKMREAQMCKILCRLVLTQKTAEELKKKIDEEYRVNMILDNLPLVVPMARRSDQENSVLYRQGFHVGIKGNYAGSKDEKYFINNHLAFTVKYKKDVNNSDSARIVGFEVKPYSVEHVYDGEWKGDNTRHTSCAKSTVRNAQSPQEVEDKKDIIFTYDVEFQESDDKLASRWNPVPAMNIYTK